VGTISFQETEKKKKKKSLPVAYHALGGSVGGEEGSCWMEGRRNKNGYMGPKKNSDQRGEPHPLGPETLYGAAGKKGAGNRVLLGGSITRRGGPPGGQTGNSANISLFDANRSAIFWAAEKLGNSW